MVFVSRSITFHNPINEVTYLQSTGTQYIDTGVIPDQDTRVMCKVVIPPISRNDGVNFLCGSINDIFHGAKYGLYGVHGNQDVFASPYLYSYGTFNSGEFTSNPVYTSDPVIIDKNKNTTEITFIKDSTTYTYTLIEGNFVCDNSMLLFACNYLDPDPSILYGECTIYWMKIWDNDRLVRYFIPCLDQSGVACMYDKVSRQYFYNVGTGSFLYG